jgi:hypothetical protein
MRSFDRVEHLRAGATGRLVKKLIRRMLF